MAKKERAPKKEKPTKREKEILKKSSAERRENRKSNGINAIITVVIILLLIGVSTVVGITLNNDPNDPSNAQTVIRNRTWILLLLNDYDSTISYLAEEGYRANVDFAARYDSRDAEEVAANGGLVGSIIFESSNGFFEIYYFDETLDASAPKNAQTYYGANIPPRTQADEGLYSLDSGRIVLVGKGELFQNLIWKYYLISA